MVDVSSFAFAQLVWDGLYVVQATTDRERGRILRCECERCAHEAVKLAAYFKCDRSLIV